MAMMVDSANSTEHQSPLCGSSGRIDCLFATELGEFRVWHLLLIVAFVVVAALAVICKVIRCRRWPVAKKQETPASDDIRLEEIESCDHRQQQTLLVDSTPLELLPPTSTTEQREPSPRGSPYPLPQGGVVAVEGVHDQIGSAGGYTPRPLEVQVEMTEVQQQKPVQHYQLSQPLYESSMEGPMSFGIVEDDRNILSLPTTALYHPTLTGDGEGGNEMNYPRKRRFRENHVQRHSFNFETPHVSFRLDKDKLGRPQHEADDAGAVPNAPHPLSLQYTEGVASLPAPIPAPVPAYQRYGSYQGFPYIAPTGGRDQRGARNGGAGELEEAAGSIFVLSAEV